MKAEKKNTGKKGSPTPAEDHETKKPDEFAARGRVIREKLKANRVNYIVKDLPIY